MPQRPNETAQTPKRTLGTAEVAALLHVSPKTVARWAKEGKLPVLNTLGSHRRYPEQAIRELADELRKWPDAEASTTARSEPTDELGHNVRPLHISDVRPLSGELARELLRVLREEDLGLPEDSTVLALVVEPQRRTRPPRAEHPADGVEGLIGVLGDLDVPADASERVDEYVYGRR